MIKRTFDFVLSLIGLAMISPLLILIAILLKIFSPGPVFFLQERVGKNGEPFIIYKFRTMTVSHGGNTVSVKGENRITPIGAFLRKYKLDELPELWNVLVGEMSLVGPRPDVKEFTDRLVGDERNILKLRPGVTGPATLKYSDEEELLASVPDPQKYTDEVIWPDKIRINLDYCSNHSFVEDLKIILKTVLRIKD